jgi:hypothetical protein
MCSKKKKEVPQIPIIFCRLLTLKKLSPKDHVGGVLSPFFSLSFLEREKNGGRVQETKKKPF